jgi:hypothetical protein
MRILAGVRKKLGGDQAGVKGVAGVDAAIAGHIECQLHLCLRTEGAGHLGYFFHELPEVHSGAVGGPRQAPMEFRGDFDARANIVEQPTHLIGREVSAALGNRVALKANNTTQTGQIVRDPMIGLSQPDTPMLD